MPRKITFTDEQIETIIALYTGDEAWTPVQIAVRFGVSRTPIDRTLREASVARWRTSRVDLSDEEMDEIVRLYVNDPRASAPRIGVQFDVSQSVIYRILSMRGIRYKTVGWPILYPVVDGQKQCATCGEWKPLASAYSRDNTGYRKDCKPCRVREGVEKNRQKWYGLTAEQYAVKTAQQKGRCAICGQRERRRLGSGKFSTDLVVDHDHETGEVRDLLCTWCNRAIGFLGEDIRRAQAVVRYLKKWKK